MRSAPDMISRPPSYPCVYPVCPAIEPEGCPPLAVLYVPDHSPMCGHQGRHLFPFHLIPYMYITGAYILFPIADVFRHSLGQAQAYFHLDRLFLFPVFTTSAAALIPSVDSCR